MEYAAAALDHGRERERRHRILRAVDRPDAVDRAFSLEGPHHIVFIGVCARNRRIGVRRDQNRARVKTGRLGIPEEGDLGGGGRALEGPLLADDRVAGNLPLSLQAGLL
jgi:hypothetical protein